MEKRKTTLAAIYFTFFVDNLCWSIVFPIFAPYFLDQGNVLFSPDVALATRTTILGVFLMAFSLGQFFGAPVLGEMADRCGRKKALAVSVFFALGGLALSAWSMERSNLWLLFVGRLVTGVFSSNMSICLACVADLSEDEKAKVKNFGYLSVLAGVSFVFGAFAGGKLSDPSISALFTPYFPLWIAAGLTLMNLVFVLVGFRETFHVDRSVRYDFLESVHHIQAALKTERIKRVYLIYFLFLFGWTLLFQFTPVLVVRLYGFTNSNIGDLAIYMGLCWAIGSGYLNKLLMQVVSEMKVLEGCLIGFTVLCGLMVVPVHLAWTLLILGFCVMIGGLAWPHCTSVISNLAPQQMQGKIMGMSQSVQSLAMAVAPLVGGVAYQAMLGLPFLIAAGASLLAAVLYFSVFKRY